MNRVMVILVSGLVGLSLGFLGGTLTATVPTGQDEDPPANAAQPATPAGAWLELHPDWTQEGPLRWQGRNITTEPGDEWTTDGETFLYARLAKNAADHARCAVEDPPGAGSGHHVFLGRDDARCWWGTHPGLVCFDASFCASLIRTAGPPPGPR